MLDIAAMMKKFWFGRSNKRSLTAARQETLRQQVITADKPGSILRDFQTLIDFIGPAGLTVSDQFHFLPLRVLADLNTRLTHPIRLDLKRPQQKSYPHLDGLYLLLRATGLTRVDTGGRKPRLLIDQAALSSWVTLTPTERYFTLLESWLWRGHPAIVGEAGGSFASDHPLLNWSKFFERIPDEGLAIVGNEEAEQQLHFTPKRFNLALLELFGFITIQHNPPLPGAGWQIGHVWRTPLGEAMLYVLSERFPAPYGKHFTVNLTLDETIGRLQPVLQPYFTEWQHNLRLPRPEFQSGRHVFKVSLGHVRKRIVLSGHLSLDQVAGMIVEAFEFEEEYLYRFTYPTRFGLSQTVNHPELDQGPFTNEVRLGELPLFPGTILTFLYSFSQSWEFEIKLKHIEPADEVI